MVSESTVWKKNRRKLNSYEFNEDWELMITLFNNRIENKFFTPIDLMLDKGNKDGIGFSIVAIQCLLIELFATFRIGKIHNPRYNKENDPKYQFKDSAEIYVGFLNSCFIFENYFHRVENSIIKENEPIDAFDFYANVRCGLLHEGKTKKNWTINLKPRNEKEKGFIKLSNGKIKIYRTILQKELRNYFKSYLKELRSNDKKNELLRRNFARKMDNLYGFKPNKKEFNWWCE